MDPLASIPSPSGSTWDINLGSLELSVHVYGLLIGLGAILGVIIAWKRWKAWGHDPDEMIRIAMWGIPSGLIGARLYHVITDFNRLYVHDLSAIPRVWDGGLGIPGGIIGGVLGGYVAVRRMNLSFPDALDAVAPAFPIAQAIGRFGNYFNQELYGRPSDLPWAIEIAPLHRPIETFASSTYHPTFAYEALWSLALFGVLIAIDRHRGTGRKLSKWSVRSAYGLFAFGGGLNLLLVVQGDSQFPLIAQVALFIIGAGAWGEAFRVCTGLTTSGLRRRGDLFGVYIAGYFTGRLWVESLRVDEANQILGLRLNEWTAILVIAFTFAVLWWRGRAGEVRPIERLSGSVRVNGTTTAE